MFVMSSKKTADLRISCCFLPLFYDQQVAKYIFGDSVCGNSTVFLATVVLFKKMQLNIVLILVSV